MNKKDEALRMAAHELEDYERIKTNFEKLKIDHRKLTERNRKKEQVVEPLISSEDRAPLEVEGVDLTDLDDRPVKEERESNTGNSMNCFPVCRFCRSVLFLQVKRRSLSLPGLPGTSPGIYYFYRELVEALNKLSNTVSIRYLKRLV